MNSSITRRSLLAAAPVAVGALQGAGTDKPAMLGGRKARNTPFHSWPKFDNREERALLDVLRSGHWYRGSGQIVKKFEAAYSELTGAKQCLATANGTAALVVSLNVLGVEPGDEVIIPPYTFIATANVVLRQYALPVFVDSDIETFQIDHRKVEASINQQTRAIMPVHLGGNAANLDVLLEIARRRKIPLIEDACQAHLGEWKGRKVGTWGDSGCFSFQASKNLNSGEGGAILFNDEDTRERAYAFHNNGSGLKFIGSNFNYASSGANLRLTEFQAAILLAQMTPPSGAGENPLGKRQVSHLHAQGDSGHLTCQGIRRLHEQRLPPLHVSLRRSVLRRLGARYVSQSARRRRHSGLKRIQSAQHTAVPQERNQDARLSEALLRATPQAVGGAKSLPPK